MINDDHALTSEIALPAKRSKGKVIGIVVAAVAVVIAGAGLSFALLSGGGAQPEDILPKDTVALAKIDLNPKIGQRINLVRFLAKFPKTFRNFDQEDPVGSLINQTDASSELQWSAIKPWIGTRYAVAVIESSGAMNPILVVSVKDEAEVKYYLAKNYPELNYEIISGFLVAAEKKSTLNLITSAPSHLSDNEVYKSDMHALGGDQIAVVWADLKPIAQFAQNYINDFLYQQGLSADLNTTKNSNGRVVIGMHFTSDTFVTDILTRGIGSENQTQLDTSESLKILGDLPASTLGAVNIEGIGASLTDGLLSNSAINDALNLIGLKAKDISELLQGPIAVIALDDGKTNDPLIFLRLTPKNPSQTIETIRMVLRRNGLDAGQLDSLVIEDGQYLYLGSDSASIRKAILQTKNPASRLGDSGLFKKTLTKSGNFSAYVDLGSFLPKLSVDTKGAPLGGLGISIGADLGSPGTSRTSIVLSLK